MNFHGFLGHLVAGGVLTALGMWHTLNTIVSYRVEGPSGFRAATWFPFPWPRLKHLELHILLSFSVLAAVDQVLAGGSPLPDRLAHATMYLLLAAYASAAFVADRRLATTSAGAADHVVALRKDAVAALAVLVFALELLLLRRYLARSDGVDSVYYWVLKLAAGVCFAASSATIVMPWSFAVAVVRSASVTFQGLWLVVMALWLWVLLFLRLSNGHEELAAVRYQFTLVLATVWVGTVYLCMRPVEDDAQSYQKRLVKIMPMVEERVETLVLDLQQRYVAAVLEAKDFLVQLKKSDEMRLLENRVLLENSDDEETPMLQNADEKATPVLEQATDIEKGEVVSPSAGETGLLKNAEDEETPMLNNADEKAPPVLEQATDVEKADVVPPSAGKTGLLKNAKDDEAPVLKNADEKAPPVLEQATDIEKGEVGRPSVHGA